MSNGDKIHASVDRRSVLKGLGTVGVTSAAAVALSGTSAAEPAQGVEIPKSLARKVARARVKYKKQRRHFTEFDPNGLAQPELFYAVAGPGVDRKYVPAAWVFPIERGKEEVGHIAISAQTWLPPVIRCGTGTAPQNRLTETNVTEDVTGRSNNEERRFIYKHPMAFGIGARLTSGGRSVFVDTHSGIATTMDTVPKYSPALAETTQAEAQWQGIRRHLKRNGALSYRTASTGSISDVPNWDGYDCSSNWIGCSPVAGSMVIGYHEDVPSWDKCDLMEELADHMNTDSDGVTARGDIPAGFERYNSSYNGYNTYYGRRSKIMNQIDSNQPCVVSYWGDKTSNVSVEPENGDVPDWAPEFIGHSETAIEYEEDDNPWWDPTEPPLHVTTHDTYGDVNELTFGSTSMAFMITSVVP